MMCLGIVSAKAIVTDVSTIDNVVYLNPVTATAGTQCVLSVQMKNVEAIAGYEFYLALPEGVTFAKDEDGILHNGDCLGLSTNTGFVCSFGDLAGRQSGAAGASPRVSGAAARHKSIFARFATRVKPRS